MTRIHLPRPQEEQQMRAETEAVLRAQYDAYAAMDIAAIDSAMPDDGVMHISGHHPLSDAYLDAAAEDAFWTSALSEPGR